MRNIVLLFFVICFLKANGQKEKNINLIIEIDEEIVVGPLSNLKIVLADSNTVINQLEADYYPGNLKLKEADYQNLLLSKSICLKFDYSESKKGRYDTHNYELNLKNAKLENTYNIIRIYNLNKRKYKKHYIPLDGHKDYVFL